MKQAEVTGIILDQLRNKVPQIPWSARLTGADRGRTVMGTVTCDRVAFFYDTKDDLVAKAEYKIYILDANSTENVDELAEVVFAALNNDDLGGALIVGDITDIVYGSSQGKPNSGIAALTYVIEYYKE